VIVTGQARSFVRLRFRIELFVDDIDASIRFYRGRSPLSRLPGVICVGYYLRITHAEGVRRGAWARF
jgi:hypothetical protein